MKNKKGISPLIATVLLIGFAVVLASVVILWGSDFIETITGQTEEQADITLACTKLNFDVEVDCDSDPKEIVITNNADITIDPIKIRVDGELVANPGVTSIDPFATGHADGLTDTEINAKKIEVIPGAEGVPCPQAITEKTGCS